VVSAADPLRSLISTPPSADSFYIRVFMYTITSHHHHHHSHLYIILLYSFTAMFECCQIEFCDKLEKMDYVT
jgi:hypothetical protein